MREKNLSFFFGTECVIAPQIKKQNKTSRYKLINWIYGKLYGYKHISTLPDGVDVIYDVDKFICRDKETLDKMRELLHEDNKI